MYIRRIAQLTLLALGTSVLCPSGHAASPAFQSFLSSACAFADAGSDFDTRCNVDATNGDLSGDSEDSLNPTQSLANNASAIAETRARIKALHDQMKETQKGEAAKSEGGESTDSKATFRVSGYSLLGNAESGSVTRDPSALERGYETATRRLGVGVDYRVTDRWIVGGLLGVSRYRTDYDADHPGTNFAPGPTEGSTDSDSRTLSLYSSTSLGESAYLDLLAAWTTADYTFRRIGLFQESSRTLPTLAVRTTADSSGRQFALSAGIGVDRSFGANTLQLYLRATRNRVSIDGYTEKGGAGFAMRIVSDDLVESTANLGVKYMRAINASFGVVVPQLFVEYERALSDDTASSLSRFVNDTGGTAFRVTGDRPDRTYLRSGAAVSFGLPNGWTAYIGGDRISQRTAFAEWRINGGLRREI